MKEQYQFWVLAVCVGIFQGAIQSMSRAYFARLIPPEKSGEYFGLYDICGKGASFLGTITVSAVSQLTGSVNLGVGALAFMFAVGAIFFVQTVRQEAPDGRKEAVPGPLSNKKISSPSRLLIFLLIRNTRARASRRTGPEA